MGKGQRKGMIVEIIFRSRYILIAIYFLLLTFLYTRPLWLKLATHTVGGYGDNLYFIWQIGWVKQAIFDLKQLPHRSHLLNYPYGYNLATTEIAPLQLLIALPFAFFGNPVLGYNISILATFFLSGLTMFFWVYQLTKSWRASLISSSAYALLPYHAAHFLIGHLNMAAIQWFPLYFMAFTSVLTEKEYSWRKVIIFAAGLSCIALTSQYYLYMTLFTSLLMAFIFLIFIRRDQLMNWNVWKQFLTAGVLSLPFLAVGILPYLLLYKGGGSTRTLEEVMTFSASITDFFLPFTKSVLAGRWVSENFPRNLWNEATLYLGVPVTFLAVFGYLKGKKATKKGIRQLLLIGAICGFVLAMGSNLNWMEEPVVVLTPDWLRGIMRQDSFYILLPGYLLFRYFPFYNFMRVWMRYGIIVMTLTCAAAGLGAARLLKTPKNLVKTLITLGLTGLVLLDFLNTPFSTVKIEPREVDNWLADQPFGGQVQLPLDQSFRESAIYYTLTNQKPLIGVIRAFPSYRFFQLDPILKNFPDEASIETLKKEQITYIVLDEKYFDVDEVFIQFCENRGLEFSGSFDGQAVFVIS